MKAAVLCLLLRFLSMEQWFIIFYHTFIPIFIFPWRLGIDLFNAAFRSCNKCLGNCFYIIIILIVLIFKSFCTCIVSSVYKKFKDKTNEDRHNRKDDHWHHGNGNFHKNASDQHNHYVDYSACYNSSPPCIVKHSCSDQIYNQNHSHKRNKRQPHLPVFHKSIRKKRDPVQNLGIRILQHLRLTSKKSYKIIEDHTACCRKCRKRTA